MNKTSHNEALARVERELAEILDGTAGTIGHEWTMFRSLVWDAKAHVKAAAAQLGRIEKL